MRQFLEADTLVRILQDGVMVVKRWMSSAAVRDASIEDGGIAAIPSAPRFLDRLAEEVQAADLRKGERTRRRVLWATAVELETTSFADLGMDQIAQRAEVSRAALYQYVGSKEEAVRTVLTDFQSRTLEIPLWATRGADVRETILRTNRYYIDYFAKNSAFMERVRELHHVMPELIAEKQRVNRAWAERVVKNAARLSPAIDPARLRLRAYLLECMIDDALREIFVIGNPDLRAADLEALAGEASEIWFRALYQA